MNDEALEPLPPLDQAVFDAIFRRDPAGLTIALAAGGSPIAVREQRVETDQDSWLHEACPLDEAMRIPGPVARDLVSVLLKAGAPINHPTLDHNALVHATSQPRWDLINRFLDEDETPPDEIVDLPSSVHRKVLGTALWHAESATLKRLIDAGWRWSADPAKNDWLAAFLSLRTRRGTQATPLPNGWEAALDLCLSQDPARLNPMDEAPLYTTPLSQAILSAQPDLVRALLDRGADPHRTITQDLWADNETPPRELWRDTGITPLHLAAQRDLPEICLLLMQHGADPDRRTDTPWSKETIRTIWHDTDTLPETMAPSLTPLAMAQQVQALAAAVTIERALLNAEAPLAPSNGIASTVSDAGARRRL